MSISGLYGKSESVETESASSICGSVWYSVRHSTGERARGRAVRLERLERLAGDDQPRALDPLRRLDRVAEPLVRPDQPEAEERVPVVAPLDVAREERHRDHAQLLLGHAEVGERPEAALRVHDDPVEPVENSRRHIFVLRTDRLREQVVRREDLRPARAKEQVVDRRRREPLDVQHVARLREQPRHPERVLRRPSQGSAASSAGRRARRTDRRPRSGCSRRPGRTTPRSGSAR